MDYAKLLFAAEVRKLVIERGSQEAAGMSEAEIELHVESRLTDLVRDVVEELDAYATAIDKHRASKAN